ncbi:E3 ubiquitin-protein ligase HECTD3-like [Montipora capricornis]|uniref:E3 ubiquitin-protein ligase HECTD3-like n=1 Tax=Montipora capricornis TaxID=246305 RepID=UPI0035F0FCEB
MKNEPARRRLARIRCLLESIKRIEQAKSLPLPLCFVPSEVEYSREECKNPSALSIHKKPHKDSQCVGELPTTSSLQIFASGDEFFNNDGSWIRLCQKTLQKYCSGKQVKEGWVLAVPYDSKSGVGTPYLKPTDVKLLRKEKQKAVKSWQEAVEICYSLRVSEPPSIERYEDKEAVRQLSSPPPKWCLEADEELAKFMAEHVNNHEASLGNISRYVESVQVSSEEESKDSLTDGDPDTYWESDGSQGRHWIKLMMRPGTVIRQLFIGVDAKDDNYMPHHVVVVGGDSQSNLKEIGEVFIDGNMTGDVCIAKGMMQHYSLIQIRIKECKDEGIDTRIHSLKLTTESEREPGLNKDLFSSSELIRFPKLDAVDSALLYRRAQALLRFTELLDSVLHYLLPSWNYSAGSFKDLEAIRQLLPLSNHRTMLIDKVLRDSQSCSPAHMPKLFVNRRAAVEHKADPAQDPDAKRSIFNQLYEGLKQEKCGVKLDYRWSARYDQWWECKFLSEGIIDQGGGFRDSLADMAEELCPSSTDAPLPLSFFIRSPNQLHDSSNVNRDAYFPNPSCKQFGKYEWIGMLMGACVRSSKEHLVLSLPSFVWRQLVGEKVTWSRDFMTVDLAQVKLLESLESMDKDSFDMKFGGVLTYTTVLSDSTLVNLVPGGVDKFVDYEDRIEYIKLVQSCRMSEGKQQIEAIRRGLLKVLSQAVLDLLTWQELERRVCGDPELSVEALKKCMQYEDISENDKRVKYLWKALENFTNDDRSRFLRFVTGRRRLPAPLFICPGRSSIKIDSLPEAATCSSTLFLPEYSSARVAEEKIRYAAYNCVAIDTDVSPWEE